VSHSPSPAHARLAATIAVCLAGALTACSSSAGTPAGDTPTAGGTLTFATNQEPDCLDPAVSARDITALVDRNVFDSLVRQGVDGKIQPWLAEKWETTPDGVSYTFHLRQGVRFHDGTALDAAAVKATFDHAVDPKTKSKYAAGLISAYKGADVTDASTIVVKLAKPSAPFLQALSTPYLGIQSPKSLADNATGLCEQPVGSGPFKFGKWDKKVGIDLTKNPDYNWGPATAKHAGAARLDALTIKFIPEDTVRVGALTSGQVDVVSNVPPSKAKSLEPAATLLKAEAPGAPYTVYLNSAPGNILADENVRKALQRVADLDQLVQTVYFGQYQRANGPLTPATPLYAKTDPVGFNQAEANKLLDEAGWTQRDGDGFRTKDGKRLALRWPHTADMERDQRGSIGQGIQAQAKQVGIDIQYTTVDQGAIGQIIGKHEHDLFDVSFVRADADILRYFFGTESLLAKGGGNIFGIAQPELDKLLVDGAASIDDAARGKIYADAQRYVVEHAIALPVYVPTNLVGASTKAHGIEFDPHAYPLFYDAWTSK
jgi:peptide/nickel transport system substrate-binding protein